MFPVHLEQAVQEAQAAAVLGSMVLAPQTLEPLTPAVAVVETQEMLAAQAAPASS
jgi:hypothetical protein